MDIFRARWKLALLPGRRSMLGPGGRAGASLPGLHRQAPRSCYRLSSLFSVRTRPSLQSSPASSKGLPSATLKLSRSLCANRPVHPCLFHVRRGQERQPRLALLLALLRSLLLGHVACLLLAVSPPRTCPVPSTSSWTSSLLTAEVPPCYTADDAGRQSR